MKFSILLIVLFFWLKNNAISQDFNMDWLSDEDKKIVTTNFSDDEIRQLHVDCLLIIDDENIDDETGYENIEFCIIDHISMMLSGEE
jgi:hypothetical protein